MPKLITRGPAGWVGHVPTANVLKSTLHRFIM